jgi:hypothetical protein
MIPNEEHWNSVGRVLHGTLELLNALSKRQVAPNCLLKIS